jgi:eukaryotic-like serine/threonine-protein kinase
MAWGVCAVKSAAMPTSSPSPAPPSGGHLRTVGVFGLLRLLGKSDRTMAWLVNDSRNGEDLFLVMPRAQPQNAVHAEQWAQMARRASRLNHPHLAKVVEVGSHDRWPYVAYASTGFTPLSDVLGRTPPAPSEAAQWVVDALQGLAFAHEAGVTHGDIQPFQLLQAENGQVACMGFEVACLAQPGLGNEADLAAQRVAATDDVLAMGLVLHRALAGTFALDEPDIGKAAQRLPPKGRDLIRLPWGTAQLIPEPLRVIANRATDRQERQRYRVARTLSRALEGWLQAEAGGDGPLALLLDRMQSAGTLPGSPGAAARAARLALMERERTNELAEVVMQDIALSFELLRVVNSAQVRGSQLAGGGAVLTVRRAIAMVGMEGVRRLALALRPWPGPMNEDGAAELERLIKAAKRAAQLAQSLRPPGYDAEVVALIALLQNLGRLVVQYHLPEEAQQIRRLMQPNSAAQGADREEPGMTQESAAYAVLGIDIEAVGLAVARQWGLDASVLPLVQRLPVATPVRQAETDDEILRAVASCANECIEALALPAAKVMPALAKAAQRYGRSLNITLRDLQEALHLVPATPAPTRPMPMGNEPRSGAAGSRGLA